MKPKLISLAGLLAVLCWTAAATYYLCACLLLTVPWPSWPARALAITGAVCLCAWLLASLWWGVARAAMSASLRTAGQRDPRSSLLCDECGARPPVVHCIMHGVRLCVPCFQWHYEDLECRIGPVSRPGIARPGPRPAASAPKGGRQ